MSQSNIFHQVSNLYNAWQWTEDDHILSFLPLHHVHGAINIVMTSLFSGATCEMIPNFDAPIIFDRLIDTKRSIPTKFMAVPTVYSRLIQEFEKRNKNDQVAFSNACHKIRVMISGSAALPDPIMQRYAQIYGVCICVLLFYIYYNKILFIHYNH